MKNNKQSSVEWLVEQFESCKVFSIKDVLEQAKAMHKEEIIQSNRDGVDMCVGNGKFITGEQYYNETFNPNEK